jgi:integrase/recombinase XerD
MSETPISPLRQRKSTTYACASSVRRRRNDNIRHVKTFSTFLGRSPALATADDLRRLDFTAAT